MTGPDRSAAPDSHGDALRPAERRGDAEREPRTGAWVRCARAEPERGTWAAYAGKVGRVVKTNRNAGEFGVQFTTAANESWFRADELVVVDRPLSAPAITTATERFGGAS